jgi:uncharacterized protein YycO
MTMQIRPTRMDLNDRFPMLGFTIRASADVDKYEVVVASEPSLFKSDAKPKRNRNNFYSSRVQGPLSVTREESVFVLPPEVLVRFIGQPKLYFTAAGYNGAGPAKAEIASLPSDKSPYINLSGFSGRSLRRVRVLPSRQRGESSYGRADGADLEWAGDAATPGMAPLTQPKSNGAEHAAPVAASAPAHPEPARAAALDIAYDDGFGTLPPIPDPAAPPPGASSHTRSSMASAVAAQATAKTANGVAPQHHHSRRPYGAAVDPRATALAEDIPLDPGNGGMSIGPDALQVGDIILSTTDAASSGLIRFGTGAVVSHALLYVDQGQQVVEAIGSGVTMRPLAEAIANATVAVAFRVPSLDDAHRQMIADAAAPHIGEPYDKIGIVRQALFQIDRHVCDILSGDAAANCRNFLGRVDLGTPRPGTFFCSELIVAAYAAAGAPLTATPPNWTSPGDLAELAIQNGALAYVGHLKAPPVSSGRSIFGLGLSAYPLAAEDATMLADRFGPEVGRAVRELLAAGVSEQEISQFLHDIQTTQPAPGTAQGLAGARALDEQGNPYRLPAVQALDGWKATLVIALVCTAIGGPLGAAEASALQALASQYRVCFGVGPALNAGLLEGGSLSAGIVVAPDGKLGFFGRIEQATGSLSGVSATLQLIITKGDLDHFSDAGYAVGLNVGDIMEVGVAGGAVLLDEQRRFHGVAMQLGVGAELQPIEVYLAAERTYATAQALAIGSPPKKPKHAKAKGLGAPAFSVSWDDVELVPQPSDQSCWATAGAMVVGWDQRVSLSPETVAAIAGRTTPQGLSQNDRKAFADAIGLIAEPPRSYNVEGLRRLLEGSGPLWVSVQLPTSGHAIVVTGIYGDGATDGSGTYVRIADPWDRVVGTPGAPGAYLSTHRTGSRYILSWSDFTREYEARASTAPDGTVNVQILHGANRAGRTPDQASPPPDYAMSAGATDDDMPLPPPPPPRARAMDAGVVEIASAIAGATMQLLSNSDGNITWELMQLKGLKHPNDKAPDPMPPFHDAKTITLDGWPWLEALDGDRISASFIVDWQYNGQSLGNVQISETATNHALLRHLHVRADVMDDAKVYKSLAKGGADNIAALRIRLHYQFTRPLLSDSVAIVDLHLFGDGTYEQDFRWTQD